MAAEAVEKEPRDIQMQAIDTMGASIPSQITSWVQSVRADLGAVNSAVMDMVGAD